jgi:hypothetical protein
MTDAQYMRTRVDPDALISFYDALEADRERMETYFDRSDDCVDGGGSELVRALLANGWRPPQS